MRLLKTLWALFALTGCLAQPAFSDCTPVSADQSRYPDRSAITQDKRSVILELKLKNSGRVRDAKVLSGPAFLGPAAINAARRKKYKLKVGIVDPQTITVDVTFTANTNVVADIRQIEPAGAMACVTPGAVLLSQEAMQRRLLHHVEPLYPAEAQARQIEGIVVLKLVVDEQGNVIRADRISGTEMLVPAAIEAVKQWKYQPAMLSGMPVKIYSTVEVPFAPIPEAKDRLVQEERIREIVFRYLFDHNGSILKSNAAVYCLSISDEKTDPSDRFLTRFDGNQPPVVKISRCGWLSDMPTDPTTGKRGLMFRITGIRWISGKKLDVMGGYYEGGLSASGDTYRVTLQNGTWVVSEDNTKWIF